MIAVGLGCSRGCPSEELSCQREAHVIAVGLGCSRGCPPEELSALARQTLAVAGLTAVDVDVVASVDLKADEAAILALAASMGGALRFYPASCLAVVDVPTPSPAVQRHVGTPSVAEAAALLAAVDVPPPSPTVQRHVGTPSVAEAAALLAAAPARLLVAKQRSPRGTCAIAVGEGR